MSREKDALLKCWCFFFLSLRFSPFSWERPLPPPPPPPPLFPPPSCSEAPLVHTLHSPPPLLFLLLLCLSFRPPACRLSFPGGLGQCWRHSRDLQEICLSEKQLVCLSTANVCMQGRRSPSFSVVPGRARPDQGTIGLFSSAGRHLALTLLQMTQSSLRFYSRQN